MKRIGSWLLRIVVGAAVLVVLFHGVENWRGRRAWEGWKRSRMALGDRFEGPMPPPVVPDAENFAAVPEIARAVKSDGPAFPSIPNVPGQFQMGPGWRLGSHEDLDAWAKAFQAPDLTQALTPASKSLEILAAASRRPRCSLPYDAGKGELPALLGFRSAGKVLRLRALDHLAHGRVIEAREDVVTLLRIAHHLESDATLISALLNASILQMALQPLWEGIADHRWRDEDLHILQEELGRVDLIRTFDRAWSQERMYAVGPGPQSFETFANRPFWSRGEDLAVMVFDAREHDWLRYPLGLAIPSGWIYQNLVARDRFWVEQMKPCLDPSGHRYYPDRAKSASDFVERETSKGWRPYHWLADISFPALLGQNRKVALVQTGLDQARVACALERHHIARGAYPESLGELIPNYLETLPTDIPAGGVLRYKREGQGYALYSIGVNGKDDGGRTVELAKNPAAIDPDEGDWVWRIPGK